MAYVPQKANAHRTDWILAVASLVLALATYFAQMNWFADATHRETVMLSTIQFLFTATLGYFTNKVASGDTFQRSMKQFAIGAYRRASDIEKMIVRLQRFIATAKADKERSEGVMLEVVGAVVDDAAEVIASSKTDWADVIGEEMMAFEAISELRTERVALVEETPGEHAPDGGEQDARLKKIEAQIEKLEASLPVALRVDVSRKKTAEEGSSPHRAVRWLRSLHKAQGGVRLRFGVRGKVGRDPSTLKAGEPLLVVFDKDGRGVDAQDTNGELVGRVINDSPLDYSGFEALLKLFFGDGPIPAKHLGTRGVGPDHELQITAAPAAAKPSNSKETVPVP